MTEPDPPVPSAEAVALLQRAAGPAGFVAAPDEGTDYGRVWARDGVICGLAATLTPDAGLIDALAQTLATLRDHQGPHGEIPSNVAADGAVSYGSLVGRVDCPLWYVVGVGALDRVRPGSAVDHEAAVDLALWLAGAWQMNGRGLIWAPLGGTWADESLQHGYLLMPQALHLWALRVTAARRDDDTLWARADALAGLIGRNYWLDGTTAPDVNPAAAARALARDGSSRFWRGGFTPAGYADEFDGFANALALITGLGHADAVSATLDAIARETGSRLVPGFHPPIGRDDPRWPELAAYHLHEFRNEPGRYHNGGLWPVVTGFMAAGLAAAGDPAGASRLADAIDDAATRFDPGWAEYHDATTGEPCGVRNIAWTAAAQVIARSAADGRLLPT